ncbi:MAG: hypothetical protein B6I26_08165 [Desulfobacteraceae bacterium 4572_130]|nr:MAG: hypothetical protein B6I26_08165 [Desulfobacteraceae bacterium 4572_130]
MRPLIIFLISFFFLSSCGLNLKHHRKIALATKKLGEAYLTEGNYTGALKEFLDAEKIIPNNCFLQNDLGLVYMAKQRPDLGEIHFKKAVELKPDYIPAKNNLGTAYLKQRKWDLAIEIFKSISDNLIYATPHFPLSNLGWAYLGKKEYNSAKKYFLKALKIKPDFINAIHGLANVYIKTKQLNIALNIINQTIKDKPSSVILYADLAEIYEAKQQFLKAKKSWEQVVKLSPKSRLGKQAQKKLKNERY